MYGNAKVSLVCRNKKAVDVTKYFTLAQQMDVNLFQRNRMVVYVPIFATGEVTSLERGEVLECWVIDQAKTRKHPANVFSEACSGNLLDVVRHSLVQNPTTGETYTLKSHLLDRGVGFNFNEWLRCLKRLPALDTVDYQVSDHNGKVIVTSPSLRPRKKQHSDLKRSTMRYSLDGGNYRMKLL